MKKKKHCEIGDHTKNIALGTNVEKVVFVTYFSVKMKKYRTFYYSH